MKKKMCLTINLFSCLTVLSGNSADVMFVNQFTEENPSSYIMFEDEVVKNICLNHWDANGDGELSLSEAAIVNKIDQEFNDNRDIISFNELRYFTHLKEIAAKAFYDCRRLTSISLPESLVTIGDRAFFNCAELKEIYIPASVTSIGSAVFSCCTILDKIEVASDNNYYDSHENCNAIIETSTGKLIAGCNNTIIPEGVTAIETEAFRGMFDLEGITLPETLTRIGNRAFYYCQKLTGHLSIPEGVTAVETYAFYKCTGLTSFELPSTLNSISHRAFYRCDGMTVLKVNNPTPIEIQTNHFSNYDNCTLIVPKGAEESYQKASVWKKFNKIISEDHIVEVPDVNMGIGGESHIKINLYINSDNEYTGYQFDIVLPEGFSLIAQSTGYSFDLSERFNGDGVACSVNKTEDGSYRVICYSTNHKSINGTGGTLITLPLISEKGMSAANYIGQVKNVILNNISNNSIHLNPIEFNIVLSGIATGDVNHDGTVNITDVLYVVDYILGKYPANFSSDEADMNGDGDINVSDVLCIIDLILGYNMYQAPANARMAMFDNIYLTGRDNTYTLCFDNSEPYIGCQMRLLLPEGCTLCDASLAKEGIDEHKMEIRNHSDGEYMIIVYTIDGKPFKDGDTPLIRFNVNGNHNSNDIQLTNLQFTNQQFETVLLPDVNGIATNVRGIDTYDVEITPAYNTQGIRVNPITRGIVISNGHKYIHK